MRRLFPSIEVSPNPSLQGARSKPLLWHILSLYRPGAGLILDAVRRLERGEPVIGTPQDPSDGAYYSFPTDDDMRRFAALGWRLLDREDVGDLLEAYGCMPAKGQAR